LKIWYFIYFLSLSNLFFTYFSSPNFPLFFIKLNVGTQWIRPQINSIPRNPKQSSKYDFENILLLQRYFLLLSKLSFSYFFLPEFLFFIIKLNGRTLFLHLFCWLSAKPIQFPWIKNNPQDTILKIVCYFKDISYPYLNFLLVVFPHQSSQLFLFYQIKFSNIFSPFI